ncbi:hypothetical protein, partial [Herbaspirillum robiniae]|uniref:hypothetical protein n=1 Tax=Herbaspirillum robiniae TaxID=2014887 RepID=UPI001C30F09A
MQSEDRSQAIPFQRKRISPLNIFYRAKRKTPAQLSLNGRFIWRSGRGSPTPAQAAESLASDSLLAPPGA